MGSRTKKRKKKNNRFNSKKNNSANKYITGNVDNTYNKGPIRNGSELKKKKNKKDKKRNKKLKMAILIICILFFLLFLIAGGVFAGIFFSDKFAMTKEDLLIGASNTIIYDADGNVIAELSGKENRKIISLNEMSQYLPKAFVAIEDERFYNHKGVDIKRTAAATFEYLTHSGESNFGGSTITQQLVKNITNEKDSSGTAGMQRKIREMSRAYQIEKMLNDKNLILELYLNLIPLASSGGDICGVETASRFYFNKSASELTIEECAFLAGVTHSPTQYNPYKENPNTEKINSRTKTVLSKMKELGFIAEEQYNGAIAKVDEGLKFEKGELPSTTIKDYYIAAAVEQVINDLVEQKGMSYEYAKSRVYSGGLKIHTTQIKSVQEIVQNEYKTDTYVKPGKTERNINGHTQSAMVIIDHKTGKVVGCMGGLGTDVDAIGINRVNSERQPGSSIKPIGVYGPALEKGIVNASTIYDNTPTIFGSDKEPWPKNASNQKSGLCTVRDAIEVSSNVVACKVMTELGPDNAIDFMRELGIVSLKKSSEVEYGVKNDTNLSTALGGLTSGISPLQMAAAYAAIANNGVYIEPTFYTVVEDSSGNELIKPNQETKRVFSEGNAYVMQNLLKQPVEGSQGTARVCRMDNIDVAAKTGTTTEQKDLWLCGFTPYYTAATWYGYDYQEPINYSGGSPATLIWSSVMKKVHTNSEAKRFQQPSNVVTAKICRTSGKVATGSCSNTYTEYFVEGAIPGKCDGHNSFEVCSETKKLATEFCPSRENIYGIAMPEKEANAKWKTNGGNKYSVITEKCDSHTAESNNTVVTIDDPQTPDSDIKVIDVVGMSESAAKSALGNLTVKIEYKSVSNKTNGVVLSQSVKPGTIVSKKAKITLVVNKIQNQTSGKPSSNEGDNSSGDSKPNNPTTSND